jgi:hypothetical protein
MEEALTEKPADRSQEKWEAECERRRLLMGRNINYFELRFYRAIEYIIVNI